MQRQYVMLGASAVAVMLAGVVAWHGGFGSSLSLSTSTCMSMSPDAIISFNEASSTPWHPPHASLKGIADVMDAPSTKDDRGHITEMRCRGMADMADGTRVRVSYKLYTNKGAPTLLVGTGHEGETRVFKRE